MRFANNRVLFVIARVFQILVAAVFLIAATLKALDPAAFAEQIAMYEIFPHLSHVAALTLILVEVLLATALVVNIFPRVFSLLMIALLIFFIGITWYGMSIGLGEGCGCFGNLVHRGPEQVILEDVIMLLMMVFAATVLWHRPQSRAWWRIGVTAFAGVLAAVTIALSPYIPADDLVTQLRAGAEFTSWPVDGLFGTDLNSGTRVVFLFSVHSDDLQRDVNRMNEIAQQDEVTSAVGLIVDGTEHLTSLMFEYAAAFPIGAVEPRFARPLYRRLPRVFVLRDGVVTHAWSELPSPIAVVKAVRSR